MIFKYSFEAPVIEIDGKSFQKSPSEWLEFVGAEIPVTIANAPHIIEELRKEGKEISSHSCKALIDTGASMCVVSTAIAEKLNLHFERFTPVSYVSGGDLRPTYPAIITFEWGVSYFVPVVSCDLDDRFECFIGRDILSQWDMNYNGKEGTITINDFNSKENPQEDPVNIFKYWYLRTLKFFGLEGTKM